MSPEKLEQPPEVPAPAAISPTTLSTTGAPAVGKQSSKRHQALTMLLIVVVVILGTIGTFVLIGIVVSIWGLSSLANGCSQSEQITRNLEVTLGHEASQLRINGQSPTSSSDATTGDCLTNAGHRAIEEASFDVSEPDISTANAQVMHSLYLTASTPQLFAVETDNSNATGTGNGYRAYTQFPESNGRYYQVFYYFATPFICNGPSKVNCNRPITGAQDFTGYPIDKIEVDISNQPFTPSLSSLNNDHPA